MVMIVNKDAAPSAKTSCVICMEYVRIALVVTMALTVIRHVMITVLTGVPGMERVMDVKLGIKGILVAIPVQSSVMVSVIKTMGFVNDAYLDTTGLDVDPYVLEIAMGVVIKTLVIVMYVNLDTIVINVMQNVRPTVIMGVIKTQATVIATLDSGEIHVISLVPLNCANNECDKTTGHCSILRTCKSRYWGDTCEQDCPTNCATDECVQYSGQCIGGCKGNRYYGSKCESICSCGDQCEEDGKCPDVVVEQVTPNGVSEETTHSGRK